MTRFFTSDPHYWHANVIVYCNRPFDSVEEMNEAMVANWNKVVGPTDEVYCLGDFSLAFRPIEVITPRLNGIKYLIPGNHDWCHSYNKKSRNKARQVEWIQKYKDNGWIVLPEQTTLELISGQVVNVCHHPYLADEQKDIVDDHVPDQFIKDKYHDWRPKNDGKWLLCGHIHEKWKVRKKMLNVGVDQWDFTPVSEEEIIKVIDNG